MNKNKRILITGCSGFLASFLIDHLKEEGYKNIYGITEETVYKSTKIQVCICDIRDKDLVFSEIERIKPDITFHMAAISNVGFAWKNQKLTYEINFIGSSNLIEALARYSPDCRILLMSSAELYESSPIILLNEESKISVQNPYSLSKYAMELIGNIYVDSMNLDILKLRSFNFTGPGQRRQFVASDYSFQIAEIEKGNKEPVIFVGNLSAIRDMSDVRDVARYLKIIAREGESRDVYNICSGQSFSIRDILDILLSLSNRKIDIVVDPKKFRPVDVPRLVGDNRLIKEKFGLLPKFKLEQTLSDLLNYWRARVGDNSFTSERQ